MATAQIVSIVSAQKRTALITKYAALARQLSVIKSQLDQVKLEAIEILGEGVFETSETKLTIKWVDRPIFDQAKAKGFLTAGELAACARECSYYDVRVKEI